MRTIYLKRMALTVVIVALGVVLLVRDGVSETPGSETSKKELPRSGSISSVRSSGYGAQAVDLPWGGVDAQGDTVAPISGSISRTGQDRYVARLFNNSKEEPFSVNAEIVQLNANGTRVRSDPFSVTLQPGRSVERSVSAASSVADVQLNLRSWRSLKPPTKEKSAPRARAAQ